MTQRLISVPEWEAFQVLEAIEDAIAELEDNEDISQIVCDRLAEAQGILSSHLSLFEEENE